MAYTARTPQQEIRFVQALGYAWGRNDQVDESGIGEKANSIDFADWYSRTEREITGTLRQAWKDFPPIGHAMLVDAVHAQLKRD